MCWSNFPDSKVGFSEGFVSFGLGYFEPVKVFDVRDAHGPVMVNLPGIEPMMEVEISPGGAFISGCDETICYIWKKNTENPTSYEVFYHQESADAGRPDRLPYAVIFSNDSKVAIVMDDTESQIIDLDTGDLQYITPAFQPISYLRSFCTHNSTIVLTLSDHLITFHDMGSGAILKASYQPYFESFRPSQTINLSPKEDVLALPDKKGDMVFLRLCIPPDPLLDDIKRSAVALWDEFARVFKLLLNRNKVVTRI